MARRTDPITLLSGWKHLQIRPLGPLASRAVMHGFVKSMDVLAHSIEFPTRGIVGLVSGPRLRVVDERDFAARLVKYGKLGFGEAFIAKSWRGGVGGSELSLRDETDVVADWLTVYARGLDLRESQWFDISKIAWNWRAPKSVAGTLVGAKRNASMHYDLPLDLFRLFLDETLTYSSACFGETDNLRDAQIAKIDRILDLAGVSDGGSLLDIGCGWGYLAARAAKVRGCRVVGLTLSVEQAEAARRTAVELGVENRVTILLEDYREHSGVYDSIVSVEMIEAVGNDYWTEYFQCIDRMVNGNGRVAIQTLTFPHDRMRRTIGDYSWIDRYIFPGGELISMEEMDRTLVRETSLEIASSARISASYSRTLREWRYRFCDRLEDVLKMGFDEEFTRVWALYLAYFEAGFRSRYLDAWQVGLSRRQPSH